QFSIRVTLSSAHAELANNTARSVAKTDFITMYPPFFIQTIVQAVTTMSWRWLACQGMANRSMTSSVQNSTTPINERMTSAANIVGSSKLPMERCRTNPRPLFDPTNSPTTAPTTASVIET